MFAKSTDACSKACVFSPNLSNLSPRSSAASFIWPIPEMACEILSFADKLALPLSTVFEWVADPPDANLGPSDFQAWVALRRC